MSNTKEMIDEMKAMQKLLDSSIEKEYGLEYGIGSYSLEGLKIALLDETGELIHECKSYWCWWKKTQKPADQGKILGELVDCLHFGLSIAYHEQFEFMDELVGILLDRNVSWLVSKMLVSPEVAIEVLICIAQKLGFTIEDVFEAYKKKNEENFKRLKEGY